MTTDGYYVSSITGLRLHRMNEKELRELDAFIAEHVMGWQWWRFHIKGNSAKGKKRIKWCQLIPPNEKWPTFKTNWNGVLCKCAIENMEDATDLSVFKPTTDPAAAMQVLEKCWPKTDYSIEILKSERYGYRVRSDDGGRNINMGEWAETLPLAICLFAKQLFSK